MDVFKTCRIILGLVDHIQFVKSPTFHSLPYVLRRMFLWYMSNLSDHKPLYDSIGLSLYEGSYLTMFVDQRPSLSGIGNGFAASGLL